MSDILAMAIVALVALIVGAVFGLIVNQRAIETGCVRAGVFVIKDKAYDCKVRR